MKLRHPALINAAGFALAGVLTAWLGSLRYRPFERFPGCIPWRDGTSDTFIYAFWHETLLIPALAYRRLPVHILISQHADGELITQVCRHLGVKVTRGSATRGGAAALLTMQRLLETSSVALTPDGPKGPRRVAKIGAVKLASETGRAIVPLGFAFHRCWRAGSWDRFAVPYPFSPCVGVNAEPIRVPPGVGRGGLENYRVRLEEALLDATRQAEDRAARERW